ncbi:glycerol kinase GlpK [Sulfuriroseicoccus oceanibius]|uniref:Glycerol kinase n=1 Tax=Sulfuriroseicoccus oceanibius TaxID=2707525 RepID=A0A6B3L8V4_9BACT|nr:glycerol kinase GlpK [Sulfuriroseicoccus oceanibius]QQL45881.1 glycerol kinase GlpK [Sulfuriroseicoccus oceanibius]
MSADVIVALDQGTTSSRALVFDRDSRIVAVAQKEFTQHYPVPGWVEHDPEEIWQTQKQTLDEALAEAGEVNVRAIGIANQRETVVVWDRNTGAPVYNAIVWQDRRTADTCRKMAAEDGVVAMVGDRTGLRLDPYFSATKAAWILNHVEGAREKAERGELAMGTVDSWLVWKLTGGKLHVTDESNASRSLLYNIHEHCWDDEMLELFGIPRSMLPKVCDSSGICGETSDGVPIAGMAGDQQAALFGQACFEKGMAKNTYGTGCFLLMHTGTDAVRSENDLLTTVAWRIRGVTEYALEGSVFMGGAVVQWLRDEMKMVETAAECSELAASVDDAGGLFLVPAFAGLGAPHWDPYARGVAVGMTRGTGRTQFCRAAIEAIAYQVNDLAECMVADSGVALEELRVDGGAARSDVLLQFQADLAQVDVVRPEVVETTALGAAYLAGLAVGFWDGREEIGRRWAKERVFDPAGDKEEVDGKVRGWRRAVERAKHWEEEKD